MNIRLNKRMRLFLAFSHDSIVVLFSFLASFCLRFGTFDPPTFGSESLYQKIIIVVLSQQLIFFFVGLYKGLWRFSSTHDLKLVIKAVTWTTFVTYSLLFVTQNLDHVPRSTVFIFWILSLVSVGGGRFIYRMLKDSRTGSGEKKAIIIGAGIAGEQLAREFRRRPNLNTNIVAFIDDDESKIGRTIHGIPILGNLGNVESLIQKHGASLIFLAMPKADSKLIWSLVNSINNVEGVEIRTLPSIDELPDNKVDISSLRKVNPEDLLGRNPVQLDINEIGKLLTDEVVLVTGAGGSIGSELCKQIGKFNPRQVILFDSSEFSLYEIHRTMCDSFSEIETIPLVGDIRDAEKVNWTLKKYSPSIIYHAAAYKHVPLMEEGENIIECIRTNIHGTKTLAEAAIANKVKRVVMISTDKAVNPTNVMGATKRIAEMVCQSKESATKFMTVRFGNVLGSAGSVIPLFEEQIQKGGPVTVTHPDIVRYFMSIPEASQLVMQAGAMGKGGEIFLLEMGDPIKIHDLAKKMIKLSGHEPNVDIAITFTGLRPGEKLFEELLSSDENTLETSHQLVRVSCARKVTDNLDDYLKVLLSFNLDTEDKEIKSFIKKIVSEYTPYFSDEHFIQ